MRTVDNRRLHYRSCNLCEAICGIEITVQADQRLDIRGDKDDPFSRGYICPKAVALQDVHDDKDRLKYPVRRTPHGWQRIGWEEAFDEVIQNLKRIHAVRQEFYRHVPRQSHRSQLWRSSIRTRLYPEPTYAESVFRNLC